MSTKKYRALFILGLIFMSTGLCAMMSRRKDPLGFEGEREQQRIERQQVLEEQQRKQEQEKQARAELEQQEKQARAELKQFVYDPKKPAIVQVGEALEAIQAKLVELWKAAIEYEKKRSEEPPSGPGPRSRFE